MCVCICLYLLVIYKYEWMTVLFITIFSAKVFILLFTLNLARTAYYIYKSNQGVYLLRVSIQAIDYIN